MTKKEFIEKLNDPRSKIADNDVIYIFDPNEEKDMPVTGFTYGGKDKRITLYSDDID